VKPTVRAGEQPGNPDGEGIEPERVRRGDGEAVQVVVGQVRGRLFPGGTSVAAKDEQAVACQVAVPWVADGDAELHHVGIAHHRILPRLATIPAHFHPLMVAEVQGLGVGRIERQGMEVERIEPVKCDTVAATEEPPRGPTDQ